MPTDGDNQKNIMSGASEDHLVQTLLPKLAQHPDGVKTVSGWLGKGQEAGRWRLYITIELDEWIEFADSCVVHYESLRTGNDPLARTVVWLEQDCPVTHTQPDDVTGFLSGDILGSVLAGGPPSSPEFWAGIVGALYSIRRCRRYSKTGSGAGCSTVPGCTL